MDALRRKMGRVEVGPGPGVDRAWSLALARAARDEMALALDVSAVRDRAVSLAEVVDLPVALSLVAVLDCPGGDGLGLFAIEPALLSGLIAMLTTGRVASDGGSPRRPTRTDAAMVAPLVDAALTGLVAASEGQADTGWCEGWRYASFLEDARPLALLLDDCAYRLLAADVALGGGAVTGQILLALPAMAGTRRVAAVADDAAVTAAAAAAFQSAFVRQVEAVSCRIEAELARVTLPLAQAMAFGVGDVLPLGDATVARLVLRGLDGRMLAEGKLGQMRGQRAVRLALPVEDGLRLTG